MPYIPIEEAFSILELAGWQSSPWPPNRFSQFHLADWGRRLPDFTGYRLPEMDAAGIAIKVLSLTVPGLQADLGAPAARSRLDSRYATPDPQVPLQRLPCLHRLQRGDHHQWRISPAALTGAVLEIGAEAVLFSVDYPYESSHEAGLERTTLSDADRHKIAHGNAERILRL
jgi:amidohydrolase family protein